MPAFHGRTKKRFRGAMRCPDHGDALRGSLTAQHARDVIVHHFDLAGI